MKIKLSEIVAMNNALHRLGQVRISESYSIKTAYKIQKLIRGIEPHIDAYRRTAKSIAESTGFDKFENEKNSIPDLAAPGFESKSEERKQAALDQLSALQIKYSKQIHDFEKQMQELLGVESESEIPDIKISLSELAGTDINARELFALNSIVDQD